MSLTEELTAHLYNNEESLPKKIKLAHNVLISSDLPIYSKEKLIFSWFLNNVHFEDDKYMWEEFLKWINLTNFSNLDRSQLSFDDIKAILQEITVKIENSVISDDTRTLILSCSEVLIQNQLIQQYFKHNLQQYFKFLLLLVEKVCDSKTLQNCLSNESIFASNIVLIDGGHKYFIKYLMPAYLVHLENGFNAVIFEQVCKNVQKCLLKKHQKEIEKFIDKIFDESSKEQDENFSFPKFILKNLSIYYQMEDKKSEIMFMILMQSVCSTFKDFNTIYKFLVVIFNILGFETSKSFKLNHIEKYCNSTADKNINKSLLISTAILKVVKKTKFILSCSVGNTTYSEFLKNITCSVIYLTRHPNKYSYNFLIALLDIDPLLIENEFNTIINYTMFGTNKKCNQEHELFFKCVLDIYVKLHRMQNLVTKMLPCLKSSLENGIVFKECYGFRGSDLTLNGEQTQQILIFSNNILDYFGNFIAPMGSKQVIALFRAIMFHLNIFESNDVEYTFVNFLSKLMCVLLSNVCVAENTVNVNAVEKFVKETGDLKNIITQFGEFILNQEYNEVLMTAYLKLAHSWIENIIMLHYYCTEISTDHLMENILSKNFLHPFLMNKQWSLISERITNFGDSECKILRQQLLVQKLRALYIFDFSTNEETHSQISKYISSEMEECFEYFISDGFILQHILPTLDNKLLKNLSELVINKSKNKLTKVALDSKTLMPVLIYTILSKILNEILKNEDKGNCPSCVDFFNKINEDIFFNPNVTYEYFPLEEIKYKSTINIKNLEILKELLENLKEIPLVFVSNTIQEIIFLFLLLLKKDISNDNVDIKNFIELLLQGLIQTKNINVMKIIESSFLINIIIEDFSNSQNFFSRICDNWVKHEETIQNFKPAINYLLSSAKKYHKYLLIILEKIANLKTKKIKISKETKEECNQIKNEIINKFTDILVKKEPDSSLTDIFANTLKYTCGKNNEGNFNALKPFINAYLNINFKLDGKDLLKESILLFSVVLSNKQEMEYSEDMPLKIWNFCKNLRFHSSDDYAQLLILILQHLSNHDFENVSAHLLANTEAAVEKQNYAEIISFIKTWTMLLNLSFNSVKLEIWQTTLEKLLLKLNVWKNTWENVVEIQDAVLQFQLSLIQHRQITLSPTVIGILLMNVKIYLNDSDDFISNFSKSSMFLDSLLRYRSVLILDRLPIFLKQFRSLLNVLCKKVNENEHDLNLLSRLADCSLQLEKIIRHIVQFHSKHMSRIAPYLIADILHQYENLAIPSNVKIHLNNCIYSLISICDLHAVAYLMRVLSHASTELFKLMYDNYKRFYRFTGKV